MKLLFAADICLQYSPFSFTKELAQEIMRSPKPYFSDADFSVLNLENVIGNKENYQPITKAGPNLMSTPDSFEIIKALNPTVVNLANNHAYDYGEKALFDTMQLLKDNGYQVIGAGKNLEEGYAPAVLEKDGVLVAIIGFCENEEGVATEFQSGTAGLRLAYVKRAIDTALKNGCKPILFFHGGNERNPFPSPRKTELYRLFVDMGAAAVVCMHPHCPQGVETYKGAPIIYSMGNFFFPKPASWNTLPSWQYGYMTSLTVDKDEIKTEIIPYKFDTEALTVLEGDEKAEFMRYIDYISAPISDPQKIQAYFDSWSAGPAGDGYCNHVYRFSPELVETVTPPVPSVKNMFTCEAHTELMSTRLQLVCERRLEQAKAYVDEIALLQQMKIPK